jgi:hypothetical protein
MKSGDYARRNTVIWRLQFLHSPKYLTGLKSLAG